MKPHPRVSATGLELVKRFEGLRRRSARLADGGWTIGYGHTRSAREGVEVTEQEAETLLIYDLDKAAEALDAWCFTPLNQNQADALIAFAFNIGLEAFRTSQVLRWVNEGHMLQAAAALELWRKAEFEGESLVFDALIRRRAAEKGLFLTPVEGFRPAPSPVLKPLYDPSVVEIADQQRAARLRPVQSTASLDGDRAELIVERPVQQAEHAPASETAPEREPAPETELPSPSTLAASNLAERLTRLLEREEPALAEPEPETLPLFEAEEVPPPPPPSASAASLSVVTAADQPGVDPFAKAGQRLDADNVFSGPFGRRARSPLADATLAEIESYSSRIFILGLLGLAMVLGSLVAMLGGRSSLTSLIIGLVGVLLLVPAAARIVTVRLERRAVRQLRR